MAHPISIRFRRESTAERLKSEAAARSRSTSALAEELIDEGLRLRRHPLIMFRDGPAGRRAALVGGPDVWEVIAGALGGDVPAGARIDRAIASFGLTRDQVETALAYYAEYPAEVDDAIADNRRVAEEAEAAWSRKQSLLSG